MAEKNRVDLKEFVDNKLPTGGTPITSSDHRLVEKDIIDSCLVPLDDDSRDIVYRLDATSATVYDKINENFLSILKRPERLAAGYITLGNAFGLVVGSSLNVSSESSAFANCIVSFSDTNDTLITLNFSSPIPSSYTVRFEMESRSGDFNNDNDIIHPITKNKTSNSMQIGLRTMNTGATRNIRLHVELYFNNF